MRFLFMFFVFALLALVPSANTAEQVTKVKVGETKVLNLGGKRRQVCVTEGQRIKSLWEAISPLNAFLETTLEMHAEGAKRSSFPFFSVRGKSTDDFHLNVGMLIQRTLLEETPNIAESVDKSSLLRDLLSSCPSPIDFKIPLGPSDSTAVCRMTFSSMGTPCVSIPARASGGGGSSDIPSKVTIAVKQAVNLNYAYNLGLCLLFLYAATELSEHKTFQYATGMALFVAAGLLLVVIYMDKIFGLKNAKARTTVFLVTSSAVYATSFAYFLQSMLRRLLVDYWELVAMYIAAMSLLSILFTRFMRSKEETKHFFRISAKWFMRSVALVAGYNAFPSPLSAMIFLFSLSAAYAVHWCGKWLGKSSKAPKETLPRR